MNYEIIRDKEILEDFLSFLPNLEPHEQFYVCLFSRSKYCNSIPGITHIKTDKQQVRRFTATKENLIPQIQQLECPLGTYYQKQIQIPQESLALYINPNPRDFIKATRNGLIRFAHLIAEQYNANRYNPHQEIMSEIQRAKSRMVYFDMDIDDVTLDDFELIKTLVAPHINMDAVSFLNTRGGFHVLVKLENIDRQYSKTWYNGLASALNIDIKGDCMMPIPGCTQGNFIPKFIR
jgi:hypothetical protein